MGSVSVIWNLSLKIENRFSRFLIFFSEDLKTMKFDEQTGIWEEYSQYGEGWGWKLRVRLIVQMVNTTCYNFNKFYKVDSWLWIIYFSIIWLQMTLQDRWGLCRAC